MKKLTYFLMLCVIAGCSNYQEPQANCFSFVSRSVAPVNCDFEPLNDPHLLDLEDIANE